MRAINQKNRFIPNLAILGAPIRPLSRKENDWTWEENEEEIKKIKYTMKDLTEIKHSKRDLPLEIICDVSEEGLGAVLQQQLEEAWETTHYASQFLTDFEKKSSINELDMLAVVWATEKFKTLVYVTQFEILSDHKDFPTILRDNRFNKMSSSRITRW